MGFIQTAFDVRKLSRLLDRKKALPENDATPIARAGIETPSFADLDEYIFKNIAMSMLVDGSIPIGKLDFDRITYEDIEKLSDAFNNSEVCEFLGVCAALDSFSPTPVERNILI